ncbi:hypothetical protein CEXT_533451 [Caerostris extrusa]|uniref:Uncharacterized protein n=1 Tax=Caerostris extrusa TaxID=172846 RepID=A0AAV4T6C8_CAEEX|nr:hypothetical protein CEXT_533451 [Caerostris extrusa]
MTVRKKKADADEREREQMSNQPFDKLVVEPEGVAENAAPEPENAAPEPENAAVAAFGINLINDPVEMDVENLEHDALDEKPLDAELVEEAVLAALDPIAEAALNHGAHSVNAPALDPIAEAALAHGAHSVNAPGLDLAAEDDLELAPELKAYTEYYPDKKYAVDENGDEIYARTSEGDEVYLKIDNQYVFAKKTIKYSDKEPAKEVYYAALDRNGLVKYPTDLETGRPIFPKGPMGGEIYVFHPKTNERIYPTAYGRMIYAIYPNGDEFLLKKSAGFMYARNNQHGELYPKRANGDEYYFNNGSKEVAARDEHGNYYYAKTSKNCEVYPKEFY